MSLWPQYRGRHWEDPREPKLMNGNQLPPRDQLVWWQQAMDRHTPKEVPVELRAQIGPLSFTWRTLRPPRRFVSLIRKAVWRYCR